ncbi:MAG: putative transposase/invertase (TIGR01784 family) [Phenylobacterium sp.]|jgi:predicted transposase/invertase (TIGR01784 family)
MVAPVSRHDKFFRSSMQNIAIAQEFFQHYLPGNLRSGLDFDAIKLENSSYIDDKLGETISDMVYSCPYNIGSGEAKVVLLLEHQSTPERLMPFRVYHYMFNMLYSLLKQRPKEQAKDKLPAIYALVFYHGKQSPYPYSMDLIDCFSDPLGIMKGMFENPVNLIDIGQASDDELKRQKLLGMMTGALKHCWDRDISPYLLQMEDINSMDLGDPLTLKFAITTFYYLLSVGNIVDIEQFIVDSERLPEPIRGEIMTAAEKLQAMGAKKARKEVLETGREEGREEVAINSLKEGVDPQFVVRITGLELAFILKLKAQLEKE